MGFGGGKGLPKTGREVRPIGGESGRSAPRGPKGLAGRAERSRRAGSGSGFFCHRSAEVSLRREGAAGRARAGRVARKGGRGERGMSSGEGGRGEAWPP